MVILECKKVHFYSEIDENLFFEWIKKINCILKYEGKGISIFLHIKSSELSKDDLLDLIALFQRYKINMKQLGVFSTSRNNLWFKAKEKYWYKNIFEK